MNLWFRLTWYLIWHSWQRRLELPEATSRLRFRVWPLDLDTSLHLNNGRYLALMDQGRLDILVSGGLLRAALRHGWTPIANAIQIRFRRELSLFEPFEIHTRIIGWRENEVVMEQVFVFVTGNRAGHVAARALFAGGLYDRKAKAFVAISRLMSEVGATGPSPPLPVEAEAFLDANARLRDVDRRG